MKILPINNSNNNSTFRGSIDKSVIKYLKDIKHQTIKNRNIPEFGAENTSEEAIRKTTDLMSEILTKLKLYMAKTQKNTKIALEEDCGGNLHPVFINDITKTKLMGSSVGIYLTTKPIIDNICIELPATTLKSKKRSSHDIGELRKILTYIDNLSNKICPERIDFVLFKKMIEDINSKDGTSKIKQFITKKRYEKADKYAREFYHTPMFVEKYKITQAKNKIKQQQTIQEQKKEGLRLTKKLKS